MTLRVAVDFGTSSTCAAVSLDKADPQVVVLDGSPVMSSAVFAASDGELFVGKEAERQAAIDPARYEPHPKRRIDERELLLGSSVIEVLDVVAAVLRRAVTEARRLAGDAEIDVLVLTHPANWGAVRSRVLRQAGHELANEVVLLPEPVAAAVFHAAGGAAGGLSLSDGDSLAVLDLGGGTVDVSVVRRRRAVARSAGDGAGVPGDRIGGFGVLSTKGDPNFGGADIDQLLLGHIGSLVTVGDPQAWQQLVQGRELPDRRRRRVLAEDVRSAKESLSRHSYTDVPMPPPFPDAHVRRADLERLIAAPLGRTAELTTTAISDAGLRPQELAGVFLVGGSSRIPMVARLVHERTGIVPTTLDQPETVVARGALRALSSPAAGSGDEQTTHIAHPGRGRSVPAAAPAIPPGAPGQNRQPATGGHRQLPRPAPGAGPPAASPPRPTVPPQGGGPNPGPAHGGGPNAVPPQGSGPHQQGGGPNRQPPPPGIPPPAGQQPEAAMRARRRRIVLGATIGAVVVLGVLVFFLTRQSGQSPGRPPEGKQIAQYDYRFSLPAGWIQTGGDSDKRQVLIGPEGNTASDTEGTDAIGVQEFKLTTNTDTDRQTAVDKLRQNLGPKGSTGFTPSIRYGGKEVVYYRTTDQGATVDWYVLFSGRVQVSTGCQFTENGKDRVARACEHVVRSLAITR